MPRMTPYERECLEELKAWEQEAPALTAQWAGKAVGPAGSAMQAVIPDAVLRGTLRALDRAAERFSGRAAFLKLAKVSDPAELREAKLETCDALAVKVQRRAMALAGGTGAVLGVAGMAGLVADVPMLVTQALRAVRRIGYCYGEDTGPAETRRVVVGVFALASATSEAEKALALHALRSGITPPDESGVNESLERAAHRELAKEAAVLSVTNISRALGKNLGWRRAAAGALPGIGAIVGGSVNAWYLHDVTSTARYVFLERWLAARFPKLALAAPQTLDA